MHSKTKPDAAPSLRRLLDSLQVAATSAAFPPSATIFAQGDPAAVVMYLNTGRVRLSVTSPRGREAEVRTLRAHEFFGEDIMAGRRRRMMTAQAVTASSVIMVDAREMRHQLRRHTALADWFRSHMLVRNIRGEEALVDQMFNCVEKRLARALLSLARYGKLGRPHRTVSGLSTTTLAEMLGTTRSRVVMLMKRFRELGFIADDGQPDGAVRIHRSLVSVVLRD